jgi:hypothetical protein
VDLTIVSAAYTGAKFAKEELAAVLQHKLDEKPAEKISEALDKSDPIQDALFATGTSEKTRMVQNK